MHDSAVVYSIAIAGLLRGVRKLLAPTQPEAWRPPENTARLLPELSPFLEDLLTLADLLSAGERTSRLDLQENSPPQQLVSIFDRISLTGEPRSEHYLPLRPLALSEDTLFPIATMPPAERQEAYRRLQQIVADAAGQEIADPATYLENLNGALQVAAWCVTSGVYRSVPDISLYDHTRTTAALAVCLHELGPDRVHSLLAELEQQLDNETSTKATGVLAQPAALLVGGDLSGVQSFLYTLTSKGAARSLRGRSFYLQLLTEAVLRYLLEQLGLPITNVIYAGGGHFYFLAPLSAQDKLPAIRRYITSALLSLHGPGLYLAVESAALPAAGFLRGRLPVHWDRLQAALATAKLRRYAELGDQIYKQVFTVQLHGGNREHTCAVCGLESEHGGKLEIPGEPDAWICSLCESFRDQMGRDLPRSSFVVLGLGEPRSTDKHTALEALQAFGVYIRFATPGESLRFPADYGVQRAVVWALDDSESWPQTQDLPTARLRRYTVNQVPDKEFDELQKEAEGIKRLGVLRMDVDNLGQVFRFGFGSHPERSLASLARIAALSSQLSLYFEGWVKAICARHRQQVYTVYAGGDDLFIIAPWNLVPGLALDIRSDFSRYTGGNPDLHLSGGMAFIDGKYPVYQAAEDAGDAEDLAKGLEGKNAFAFLGRAWKWDDFEWIRTKHEALHYLVLNKDKQGLGGPQAILQHLRQFAIQEEKKAREQNHRPVWGPWMWRVPYIFTRMAADRKNDKVLENRLLALCNELAEDNYSRIGHWGCAARWTQLLLRETSDE